MVFPTLFSRAAHYTLATLFMAFCFLANPNAQAQTTTATKEKPARILFLLDASGSMANKWQGQETRYGAATQIILAIIDSVYAVNPSVAFGLRAFGEDYPAKDSNCTDTKLEVPFAYQNRSQIEARLNWMKPRGFSPIALSLKQAAEQDFVEDDRYAYSIILITDGGESCGGDICATVENLLKKKISFTPYILSLINYKPILDSYKCLGNVLTVANKSEIEPAIEKIVNDNRKILAVKTINIRIAPPTKIHSYAPPVVVPPPAPKPKKVVKKTQPKPKPIVVPKPKPQPKVAILNKVTPIRQIQRQNVLFALPSLKPLDIPKVVITPPVYNQPKMTPTVRPIKKHKTVTVKHNTIRPSKPSLKNVDFYVAADDAQKTTLQVYFTDGHGTFYYTEPEMDILDAHTGKKIKETYRVLTGRTPKPIDIKSGTYDIVIPGSKSKAVNVTIQDRKANKVYIRATTASLAFSYSTDANRPVKEYKAYVSNRFSNTRRVVTQRCDTQLLYPPGNYHIEINTIPKLVYNIDLNFNELKIVTIPTPGTFVVLNTQPMEKIQLWHQLGNSYVPFLNMKISGHPDRQKVKLLPGLYEVRYFKSPHVPYEVSTIVKFRIQSEQTTSVTLEN